MYRYFIFAALSCALLCWPNETVSAQTAVGLRLGYPASISLKLRGDGAKSALEAFVGYRSDRERFSGGTYGWTNITIGGLYQIHEPLELGDIDGLSIYYGGGAAAYLWSYDDGFGGGNDYGNVSFGILGNAGVDYVFENIPVNISVDWMPSVFLGNGFNTGFGWSYGALSVRYILSN